MSNAAENYLSDMLSKIIEDAKEAKRMCEQTGMDSADLAFQKGRAMAYYEVVSTLLNHGDVFGLSHEQIPALDFDADRELLS